MSDHAISIVILSAAKDLCPLKMHPVNYFSAHPIIDAGTSIVILSASD